jgi:hypothetical protein
VFGSVEYRHVACSSVSKETIIENVEIIPVGEPFNLTGGEPPSIVNKCSESSIIVALIYLPDCV